MKVSISKSVARAFDVLESFRSLPAPATATEVRTRLNCPHSSVVAVLQNLTELGYLSYDPKTRLYYPTNKLAWLGMHMRPPMRGSGQLAKLAQAIATSTGHTTVIASRVSIFLNVVFVSPGSEPNAAAVSQGVGAPLAGTMSGLAILSQVDDSKIAEIVDETNAWSRRSSLNYRCDLDRVLTAVEKVRRSGAASGLDTPRSRDQVVAYPLTAPFSSAPMALSVVGSKAAIGSQTEAIRGMMEHYVQTPSPAPNSFLFVAASEQAALR